MISEPLLDSNGIPEMSATATIPVLPTSDYTRVRITNQTAYSPSIADSYSSSLIPRAVMTSSTPSVYTPRIAHKWSRRSYDTEYNRCNGPPSHDLATNSLREVCHFVVNVAAQHLVVSLRPTTAAYMPSWVGFMMRLILACVGIYSTALVFLLFKYLALTFCRPQRLMLTLES